MAEMPAVSEREAGMQAVPPPVALRIGFWACILIAIAVVIRRVVALAQPLPQSARAPGLAALDRAFEGHALLTLAHILLALSFVILAPIVLLGKKSRFRAAESWLFASGLVVGLTAYAMSIYSVGGWTERSAVLLFDTLFLYSLLRAWRENIQPERRRWLVRAIVILLGIATTRPVMVVFFATSKLTKLKTSQFFGLAFWVGFSINLLAVELWLRSKRRRLNDEQFFQPFGRVTRETAS